MPKIVKRLSNAQIQKATAKEKAYKLSDGEGLYLYISKTGVKSWRMDYVKPTNKKRATITIGQYPIISLADARKQKIEIKRLLTEGIDPKQQKVKEERERLLINNNTFAVVAEEYISIQTHLAKGTIHNNRRYIRYLNEVIGNMPISQIKPLDVLQACRKLEDKGYIDTAGKMKSIAGRIFRYAVLTSRAERDVTQDLRGALKTPQPTHLSAIVEPKEFAHLLRAIDSYEGYFETTIALKLMPILFTRTNELRHALWQDIDIAKGVWKFTPMKTRKKTGIELVVPLPRQAIELIKQLAPHRRSKFLFPAIHTTLKPMSENTLTQALRRLGYTGEQQTVHGFRASARTMIVEQLKYDEKLVEMQLGHRVRDMHGRAYNRVQWLDERKKMMQDWADYLDELKSL